MALARNRRGQAFKRGDMVGRHVTGGTIGPVYYVKLDNPDKGKAGEHQRNFQNAYGRQALVSLRADGSDPVSVGLADLFHCDPAGKPVKIGPDGRPE